MSNPTIMTGLSTQKAGLHGPTTRLQLLIITVPVIITGLATIPTTTDRDSGSIMDRVFISAAGFMAAASTVVDFTATDIHTDIHAAADARREDPERNLGAEQKCSAFFWTTT